MDTDSGHCTVNIEFIEIYPNSTVDDIYLAQWLSV
jgi:hypothetical protein